VLDQPLLGEEPQRLPQRGPADPETPGELLLDEALTGLGAAAEDLPGEPDHRELDQAGAGQLFGVPHRNSLADPPAATISRWVPPAARRPGEPLGTAAVARTTVMLPRLRNRPIADCITAESGAKILEGPL
jgi:hypothetical protein